MSAYLTMMYVTLDQEKVLKDLFYSKGWPYCKIDMSVLTESSGPTIWTGYSIDKKPDLERDMPDTDLVDDVHEENVMEDMCEENDENDEISSITPCDEQDLVSEAPAIPTTQGNQVNKETIKPKEQIQNAKQKSFLCPKCGKCFQKRLTLNSHLAGHNLEATGSKRKFVCSAEDCGKSFDRKSHWLFHMNIHEHKFPFVCEYCGNEYSSQYSHKRHIRVSHTGDGGRCSQCGKFILEKEALIAHKSICHAKAMHRCKLCGAVFKWKARLRRHLKKHEGTYMGDDRYDRSYIDYTNTEVTPMVTRKEIIYRCETCLKEFKLKHNYDSHAKANNCVKNKSGSMSDHLKTQKYSCSDCNKTFKWKQSFYKHRKKHHGVIAIQEDSKKQCRRIPTRVEPSGTHRRSSLVPPCSPVIESSKQFGIKSIGGENSQAHDRTPIEESSILVVHTETPIDHESNVLHGRLTSMKEEPIQQNDKTAIKDESGNQQARTNDVDESSFLNGGKTPLGEPSVLHGSAEGQEIVVYYIPETDKTVCETDLVNLDDADCMTIRVTSYPEPRDPTLP